MKATLMIDNLKGFRGYASLYQMDPPYDTEEFVIVSSVSVLGTPETYIFPATKEGIIKELGEMYGLQNVFDHKVVLEGIGYTIETTETTQESHKNQRKEYPCPQCGRMNDIVVTSCWFCERKLV